MFATDFARNVVSATGALLIGGLCLTAATAPAAAATPITVSKAVSHADLDLNQPQGRAALDARIKPAAKSVCFVGGSDIASRRNELRCTRTAIAAARS